MPSIAAAACNRLPGLTEDWGMLRAALAARGVEGHVGVWDDPAFDWTGHDLVVIRGTWDYPGRLEEFLVWTARVAAATRLVNPPAVVAWNSDKRYLAELAAAGVPVVPTVWVAPGAAWEPPGDEFVVKPTVSVGAEETARYRLSTPGEAADAAAHVARLHGEGQTVMVQPFVPSVEGRGEASLVYFGGAFSHAGRKDPVLAPGAGVVPDLGPDQEITPLDAPPSDRDVAAAALAACPGGPFVYARVDLFHSPTGEPMVSEVELIEPWLFLGLAADGGAADRFALALVDALSR